MRISVVVLALGLLTGCKSAGQDAAERYEIVKRNGTLGDVCDAAKAVRDAYLKDKNEDQYQAWRITASAQCYMADQLGPMLPADRSMREEIAQSARSNQAAAAAGAASAAADEASAAAVKAANEAAAAANEAMHGRN